MSNLNIVLNQLKSEKIKERQDGLAALRTLFERDSAILGVDESGDGRAWLVIFQALFTATLNEKTAFIKPSKSKTSSSGAAAERRLVETASTVRWLIERAVHRLNRKVIDPILTHLAQSMVHNGSLLPAVTLNYVKAIQCIIQFPAHLDHVGDKNWLRLLSLSFNAILGDPLRWTMEDMEELDPTGGGEQGSGSEAENDEGTESEAGQKRRRVDEGFRTQTIPAVQRARSATSSGFHTPIPQENIEFMSIIATLLSSHDAPLFSEDYLPRALFTRFTRFVSMYPPLSSASLIPNFLVAVSNSLSQLALNYKSIIEDFAQQTWNGLVEMWDIRNRPAKEALLSILYILFPYYTASNDKRLPWIDGVHLLWHRLDLIQGGELSLEHLSFASAAYKEEIFGFRCPTFRSGSSFESEQVFSWAVLELQAKCLERIYYYSENIGTDLTSNVQQRKRTKMENPLMTILASFVSGNSLSSPQTHVYHLQVLLFFVSQYWTTVYPNLRSDVIRSLNALLSFDDGSVQSWAYICLAAVAHADAQTEAATRLDHTVWDIVWGHCIRRCNVNSISRAACHLAFTLLSVFTDTSAAHSKTWSFLTRSRVLTEIESLVRDLDVQGPPFPHDTALSLLRICLDVASQDVRLYRMHFEDKVIAWFIDSWTVSGHKQKQFPYKVRDVIGLLEAACTLPRRAFTTFHEPHPLLPEGLLPEAIVSEARSLVIRNFLLNAQLPPFQEYNQERPSVFSRAEQVPDPAYSELTAPRSRERKMFAFLIKVIDEVVSEWDIVNKDQHAPKAVFSAKFALRALDTAIISLSFGAILTLNGTTPNRRLIQGASRLISLVTNHLIDARWSADENATVLRGLEPLVYAPGMYQQWEPWEAILSPSGGTGIRYDELGKLTRNVLNFNATNISMRELQRAIWRSVDLQDTFSATLPVFRDLLRVVFGEKPLGPETSTAMEIDSKDDDFEIRVPGLALTRGFSGLSQDKSSSVQIAAICVSLVILSPVLQSTSGEPSRDKDIFQLLTQCSEDHFVTFSSLVFDRIKDQTLNLNASRFGELLDRFEDLMLQYAYARSEQIRLLVIHFLDATMHVWTKDSVALTETGEHARSICNWICESLYKQRMRSWRSRDQALLLLDKYLILDPAQRYWSRNDHNERNQMPKRIASDGEPTIGSADPYSPIAIVENFVADVDIRVRFRAAVANARLFAIVRSTGQDEMVLYKEIREKLTTNLDAYEPMLTRLLSLGNIMIASSAVRRGPYWHLLETCLVSVGAVYSEHAEIILRNVGARMGLKQYSDLFEAYAYQIAYSIKRAHMDFTRFPPRLLGYKDRKTFAEAIFPAFTPANILKDIDDDTVSHGRKLFRNHCKMIQKSPSQGIAGCFGDIIGFQAAFWVDNGEDQEHLFDSLDAMITGLAGDLDFNQLFQNNADGILSAILRAIGDQDGIAGGAIHNALQSINEDAAQAFESMVCHRQLERFRPHFPNVPSFPTSTIIRTVQWLKGQLSQDLIKATMYHTLRQLFAIIQNSPIVNEQYRLMNGITLFLSMFHTELQDPTLLHVVMQNATFVLAHPDLARSAQSILSWAFKIYRTHQIQDARLPDIIVRICCVGHAYTLNSNSTDTIDMGRDLTKWIDDIAADMCRQEALKSQIAAAFPAWPYDPSSGLAEYFRKMTSAKLSSVLSDSRIASNKFRMVRRMSELAAVDSPSSEQFSQVDFWRLKGCVPASDQLQDEDIIAFADLLFHHRGTLHPFPTEPSAQNALRFRHRRGTIGKKDNSDISPKQSIVFSLLNMLGSNEASQINLAYQTLRWLQSAEDPNSLSITSWPSDYATEMSYLGHYPRTLLTREVTNLAASIHEFKTGNLEEDFDAWISSITISLADSLTSSDPFYAQLIQILSIEKNFAEQILPVLVHTVLAIEDSNQHSEPQDPSTRILLSQYFGHVLNSDSASISCFKSIIDVILHLRNFRPAQSADALAYDKWLKIDFILLARKAIICGAYTTALLFLELAAEHSVDYGAQTHEDILFDIYSHIQEPDGFYGIRTDDLRQFLIRRFHHEKQWDKAFRFHGAALEAGKTQAGETEGLLKSFNAFGFNGLAMDTLQSSSNLGLDLQNSGMTYQLGWRTQTWDLPDQAADKPSGYSLYSAIKAVYRERSPETIDQVARAALRQETERLRDLGLENLMEIVDSCQTILCLGQVIQWRNPQIRNVLDSRQVITKGWESFTRIDDRFEFSHLESILATRIALVRSAREHEEREQIGTLVSPFAQTLIDVEKQCLVRLSQGARESQQAQIALNAIVRAQKLENIASFEVSQEFASVLWLQNEQKLAVQLLDNLVRQETAIPNKTQKALLLSRLGTWTSRAGLQKPTDIMSNYFDPAIKLLAETKPTTSSHASVFHACAIFAEHQYQNIQNSPDAIRYKVYVDRKVQEIQSRAAKISSMKSLPQHQQQAAGAELSALGNDQRRAIALLNEDKEKFEQHNSSRRLFLELAIDMYARALAVSDEFDDDGAIIRLCSLWFANFDDARFQEKTLRAALDRVPSRKFVFLAHQLAARLSSPSSSSSSSSLSSSSKGQAASSQETLHRLMLRVCRDHPFHSLYQVYCLRPAGGSSSSNEPDTSKSRRSSARHEAPALQHERAEAAKSIFDKLRHDPASQARLDGVEKVCNASLEWASFPIKRDPRFDKKKGPFAVPEQLMIRKLSRKEVQVPVVTAHTPIDLTTKYEDCVWIERFEATFDTAGGINLPKIINCYGSDGAKYKQLYKGEGGDDLRQDAVMEQVFELVNVVLRRDRATRKRNLSVRGYKVIPLASQAGILEFVGNTTPLNGWLIYAHPRYRPQDYKHSVCQSRLSNTSKQTKHNADELLKCYTDIRDNFKPVMRHYFTEKHKTPMSWFAMRLEYTRSVATTSIVGHVLGLGDRHTSNILIDNGTGQVVHIDLGIAFDQGKLLPIPERVPFRLTRDMVDGMGTSGTQGVFQRCAEECLRVLREGSEVIMTVLEVFKHDPLHSWTASELKLKRVQNNPPTPSGTALTTYAYDKLGIDMSSGGADEAADRALTSVARKLDKSLSVEYTVNELIAEATDVVNLATIFVGWGPQY